MMGPLDGEWSNAYMHVVSYTPLALANTFVVRHGMTAWLDQMKLQKLAFYTYGWWLAYNDERLLTEAPQVWKYGPVFSSLYGALRPFGSTPIREPVGAPNQIPPLIGADAGAPSHWVDWVWQRYGHLDALRLSDMTHEVGTPWQLEAEAHQYRVPNRHPIPDSTTRDYFKRLAANLQ